MAFVEKKVDHTLVSTETIRDFVSRLGEEISRDYEGK